MKVGLRDAADGFDKRHQFEIVRGEHEQEDRADEWEESPAALAPGHLFTEVEHLLENPLEEVRDATGYQRKVALGCKAERKHNENTEPGGEEGIGDGYWPDVEQYIWSDLNVRQIPEHPNSPFLPGRHVRF